MGQICGKEGEFGAGQYHTQGIHQIEEIFPFFFFEVLSYSKPKEESLDIYAYCQRSPLIGTIEESRKKKNAQDDEWQHIERK